MQARSGALSVDDILSVERALFSLLLSNPDLSEVTITGAGKIADDPEPQCFAKITSRGLRQTVSPLVS